MSYTVSQNTSFLTIASIVQKVISGVYFFIVSWFVIEGKTESYFAIFAAIAIFTVIADFGLGNTLTREVAQDPEKTSVYLHTTFSIKLFLGSDTIVLLILSHLFFAYPTQNIALVLVAGGTLFFDSIRNIFYGVLRARHNLKYESYGTVIAQAITLVIGTSALLLHAELIWLIVPFLVSSILHTGYAMWCVYSKTELNFRWMWDKKVVSYFIVLSLPFALAGLFAQLYSYQDSILIQKLLPSVDGDNWARAYKAAFVFQFIPLSLAASMYPKLSALYRHPEKERKMKELILGAYRYLLLLAVPLVCGITVFITPLLQHGLHRFRDAGPILTILIFSVLFSFINQVNIAVLNATRHQTIQTILVAGALIFSVSVNLILIPRFGTIGAALTSVLSSVVLTSIEYILVRKFIGLSHKEVGKLILQMIVPGCAMYLVGWYMVRFTLPGGIVLALSTYIILLFVSGGITKRLFKDFFGKFFRPGLEERS
jgi:O-antigen/teichoic acid export membrane protein